MGKSASKHKREIVFPMRKHVSFTETVCSHGYHIVAVEYPHIKPHETSVLRTGYNIHLTPGAICAVQLLDSLDLIVLNRFVFNEETLRYGIKVVNPTKHTIAIVPGSHVGHLYLCNVKNGFNSRKNILFKKKDKNEK